MFKRVEKKCPKEEVLLGMSEIQNKRCVSNDDLLNEMQSLRDDLIRIERKIDSIKEKSKIKNTWENEGRIL